MVNKKRGDPIRKAKHDDLFGSKSYSKGKGAKRKMTKDRKK